MGLLAEFVEWFALVALAFGGPALVQHYFSHASATRRKIARTERRVRQLREITERFERLQDEQRSVDARQAALDTPDLEHLGTLRQLCADLAARAAAERRAPGSTTLAQDIEALLDAAASLGNEYTRSASLGHILELYVHAGLLEQARSHARWVTDIDDTGSSPPGSHACADSPKRRACVAADARLRSGADRRRGGRAVARAQVCRVKDGETSVVIPATPAHLSPVVAASDRRRRLTASSRTSKSSEDRFVVGRCQPACR